MNRQITTVLYNEKVAPGVILLGLSVEAGYTCLQPGQFVMIRPVLQQSPLLARPFSIYAPIESHNQVVGVELLIKSVGEGTRQLAECQVGDQMALLGPLGNSFNIPAKARRHLFVAGGIGVVPLVFLAQKMIAQGVEAERCVVFVGGRSASDLVGIDRLNDLGLTVHSVTEDGSEGHTGRVTDVVKSQLGSLQPDMAYACGPWPMLAAMAAIAEAGGVPCQVSIETMMGCGMGVCLSCVVKTRQSSSPYWHACTQGPVMDAQRIQF